MRFTLGFLLVNLVGNFSDLIHINMLGILFSQLIKCRYFLKQIMS